MQRLHTVKRHQGGALEFEPTPHFVRPPSLGPGATFQQRLEREFLPLLDSIRWGTYEPRGKK